MTIARYTIGFLLSLVLTMASYYYVVLHGSDAWLLVVLSILALTQMVVQLIFFLHLGDEVGPRYKLFSFLFMMLILFVIVAGSLWIMINLNYNMMNMSPNEKTEYMLTEHDKGF